jgi:hypothetical protein
MKCHSAIPFGVVVLTGCSSKDAANTKALLIGEWSAAEPKQMTIAYEFCGLYEINAHFEARNCSVIHPLAKI